MPRPEQIIPSAGEGAPHGADAELMRLAGAVPEPDPAPAEDADLFVPSRSGVAEEDFADLTFEEAPAPLEELNPGFDELLFGATQRPDEPLEAGLPFGPGPSFTPRPAEDDRSFMLRVARELRSSPSATGLVRRLAERIEAGE